MRHSNNNRLFTKIRYFSFDISSFAFNNVGYALGIASRT